MKTNLSSQICLDRVSTRYYRPENHIDRSVLTRFEKIPTDIYTTAEEGSIEVAKEVASAIRSKQAEGKPYVVALTGGSTPGELFRNLIRMHKEEGLSFQNVVVFTTYEYYPLPKNSDASNFNSLKAAFLDHVDRKSVV